MEDTLIMLGKYAAVLAVGTTGVWATAEALGKPLKKVPNVYLAAGLGIAFAVVANGMGFLPKPEGVTTAWSHAFAVVMGLLSAFGAKQINDRVNPLRKPRG